MLKDTTISDILINGPKHVYCERRGRMEKSNVVFRDNNHLLQIIDRIISKVGRRVDETCPMVDARMQDGSRSARSFRLPALERARYPSAVSLPIR